MVIDGDCIFIGYWGAPKWMPGHFGLQAWFWSPGLNSQFQKEIERQRLKQKPMGLFYQVWSRVSALWLYRPPVRCSALLPLGKSLVVYEIEEHDAPLWQIRQGLSKEQIETRISAIRSNLAGVPAKFDFGGKLRLLGCRSLRLGSALATSGIPV